MKITKLEKKKRLYVLELDNSKKLYITEDTIVRFFLTKGKTVNQEELEEIKAFAQFSYGRNLALYHLSFKSRTVKEIRGYLKKFEIEDGVSQKIISDLIQTKWLDDVAYARTYIQQQLLSGNKGPYVLKQKLQLKGIANSIIQEVLAQEDFAELCLQIAEKIKKNYQKKLPLVALQQKIYQQLLAKGFSNTDSTTALNQLHFSNDDEHEEQLLQRELEKQKRKYSRKYQDYELKHRIKQALYRKGYSLNQIEKALKDKF